MKAVLLAGGLGSRLSEETSVRPKPLVEIGGLPIMWHIMKIYAHHGIRDFVICAGFKGHMIAEWFDMYRLRSSTAIRFDLACGTAELLSGDCEDWTVTVVDTGQGSMTGGRLRRVREFLDDETFCFTYGDGVADVDIEGSVRFHREQGLEATMTVVQPPGRFGAVTLEAGRHVVDGFKEKPDGDGGWINGGFFVAEPSAIDRIEGDHTIWEQEPLRTLAHDGELAAYRHCGFWQPMDTLRDKVLLENLWSSGCAPWKCW
jgi:glucose-1-phosphate cytidylyltransferase